METSRTSDLDRLHAGSLRDAASAALPRDASRAARRVCALLRRLSVGRLDLHCPDGRVRTFGAPDSARRATLQVDDWSVFDDVLSRGDIGFGEAYMAGRWRTGDLPGLLSLMLVNRTVLETALYGSWIGRAVYRLRHLLNRNTRRGSRRNIEAHYDLGNAFYALWLDDSMSYSAACFDGDADRSLADAQRAKVQRALRSCALQPGQRVLEIGCGWGALALSAARDFGARVHGVTISPAQHAWAQSAVQRSGMAPHVELRLQDWRDIEDTGFDAVVSIEMFEALGDAYWADWFALLHRSLKPGGRACVQTITIRDDLFERYRSGTDFIQQYVFPGGLLPSPSAFRQAARAAGLEVVGEYSFGADYAETLRRWRATFLAREAAVRAAGHDDPRFLRLWDFYLAYCESAFDEGNTGVMQFTLQRRH